MTTPKEQVETLERECSEILTALNTKLEELESYKIKSDNALANFKDEASQLEKLIASEIGVKDISVVKLPDSTQANADNGKKKNPPYITAKLYTNFESIYYFYKKYEELCTIYEDSTNAALLQEIQKSRKIISDALAALDKYKEDTKVHEAGWKKNQGGEVVGVPEIADMRCLAFDDIAVSVIDYRLQLKALIKLLIKKYTAAQKICVKSLTGNKQFKLLGDDKEAKNDLLNNTIKILEPILKDEEHVKILGSIMELDINRLFEKILAALQKGNRVLDLGIITLPAILKQFFAFEDNQIPGMKESSFTQDKMRLDARKANEMNEVTVMRFNEVQSKLEKVKRLHKQLDNQQGFINEETSFKISFLEIMIEIYQKQLQKCHIEAEIFNAISSLGSQETAIQAEEWECFEKAKSESEFQNKILERLNLALDTLLQDPEKKLELPKELGKNIEELGNLLSRVCLRYATSKLKIQAVRLGIDAEDLKTPTVSRPTSVMERSNSTKTLRKSNSLRNSIRNSVLIEVSAVVASPVEPNTSRSNDSFSAHEGSQQNSTATTPDEQRAVVMEKVAKINQLQRAKTTIAAPTPKKEVSSVPSWAKEAPPERRNSVATMQVASSSSSQPVFTRSVTTNNLKLIISGVTPKKDPAADSEKKLVKERKSAFSQPRTVQGQSFDIEKPRDNPNNHSRSKSVRIDAEKMQNGLGSGAQPPIERKPANDGIH